MWNSFGLIGGHVSCSRNLLKDEEISMCVWLATSWPPQMKLRDLRAKDRGDLSLDAEFIKGFFGVCMWVYPEWIGPRIILLYYTM